MYPWIGWQGKSGSADVLSGRHIVRVTFCHGFLIDVLSGRHFVSTYFVRHFVRKTFCQFSFFVVGFCIDKLSGRQIVRIHFDHISSMLTLFMVCLRYIWYFDHISGMLTLLSQKWPKMNQNGLKWPLYDPKWPKMALKWPKMTKNKAKWPKNVSKK